jgi:hypothetical protein
MEKISALQTAEPGQTASAATADVALMQAFLGSVHPQRGIVR